MPEGAHVEVCRRGEGRPNRADGAPRRYGQASFAGGHLASGSDITPAGRDITPTGRSYQESESNAHDSGRPEPAGAAARAADGRG
jgi:hypothetical protein